MDDALGRINRWWGLDDAWANGQADRRTDKQICGQTNDETNTLKYQ